MIKRFFLGVLLYSPLLVSSCAHKELTRDDLSAFIADPSNGLIKEVTANGYDITCQYQPVELVFANELAGDPSSFIQKRDSLRKTYERFHYFKLDISKKGQSIERFFASAPEKYRALTTYLTTDLGKDVQLITETDTIPIVDFIYTPFYGASNTTQIMLVFEVEHSINEMNVVYSDSFLGCGRMELPFKASDVKEMPALKLE